MNEFKPGQTVWHRGTKKEFIVSKWTNDEAFVVIGKEDRLVRADDAGNFTATDPNQPAEPQKCPFCGCSAIVSEHASTRCQVKCDRLGECFFEGPVKPTRHEAIAAWNSIRIENDADESAVTHDFRPPRTAESSIIFDGEPLTEEWLRKVGLWTGKYASAFEPMVSLTLENLAGGTMTTLCMSSLRPGIIAKSSTMVKNVGDARQLCRLLGVPIEEDS